ncbi:MAG: hypothetical protein ACKKMP_03265 [Candidatus Nealsonbacteria bacterium]
MKAKKENTLVRFMMFTKDGKVIRPLKIFTINKNELIGVYRGRLSRYDILIKYRQKNKNGKWSRLRTPKHIHWTVDLLMKMSKNKKKISNFLDFLIQVWNETKPITSRKIQKRFLNRNYLLKKHLDKIKEYKGISKYGEYKIEFLILIAKLLMIQEKTNRRDAYMFKTLLEALKRGDDIFSIVAIATYRKR